MNASRLLILFFFVPLFVTAQSYYKTGSFVIKGQVKNFQEPVFDFGQTTYLRNFTGSVKVQPNGHFEQQLPIQYRQAVYLYLNNDAINFTIQDKDTITLYWDNNDFKNTFSITGRNESRTKELKQELSLFYEFRNPFSKLYDTLYTDKNLTAENKYTLVKELYDRHLQAALASGNAASENSGHLLTGLYFLYTKVLSEHKLTPKYSLKHVADTVPGMSYYGVIDYTLLNEKWFWNVAEYRDFIYDYIRFNRPFKGYSALENSPIKDFNPTRDEYYSAQADFYITNIKEWFITKSIMDGFGHYNFPDVENVYNQAINTLTSPYLKDTLLKFYTAVKRLKPGNPAPVFSLKNEKGKLVSLSEFKGKVLYIDFWGVNCGPCIYDIKNAVPKLHEHYKGKDVVFISICVDVNENEWIAALKKYNLDGINLIAKGWENNPVCQSYNIHGIPHYVLIDKSGNISNNNAPTASMLDLGSGQNPIDLLLK